MTPGGRSNRERGDYFERQAQDALEAVGWYVTRSAGSFGVADLVALRDGDKPLLVSCKLAGRIGPDERFRLLEACRLAGARAVVASRPKNGRVMLAAVMHGTARQVPIDTLRVPPKKPPAGVLDDLAPAGVQLTIPTE